MPNRSAACEEMLALIEAGDGAIVSGKDWDRLYKLLPPAPDGSRPSAPLILGAEHVTSDREKRDRLIEHILWAEKYGSIEQVASYLRKYVGNRA